MTLRRVAVAALALSLTACGGGGSGQGDTAPVGVEVGEAFTWNGWQVADGWTLTASDAVLGDQETKQPNLSVEVTNDGDEARFAIFQVVFLRQGEVLADIYCSSEKIAVGASAEIDCEGLGRRFPSEYDDVQVQEIAR